MNIAKRQSTLIKNSKCDSESEVPKIEEKVARRRSDIFFMCVSLFIVFCEVEIAVQFPEVTRVLKTYGINFELAGYLMVIPGIIFSWTLYFPVGSFLMKFWLKYLKTQSSRDTETSIQHLERCRSYLMGAIYYLCSFVFTFIVACQIDFLPRVYGGSLDIKELHKLWPARSDLMVKTVYMLSYGHHIERLLVHTYCNYKTATYFTMLLHHVIAVGLIAISFQTEYFHFGFPVLLLLDLSDCLLQLARFLRETVFQTQSKILFVLMAISWMHGRVFGLCWEVLPTVYWLVSEPSEFAKQFFTLHVFYFSSLFILTILNIFWLFQILKIFVTVFVEGKNKLAYEDNHLKKQKH